MLSVHAVSSFCQVLEDVSVGRKAISNYSFQSLSSDVSVTERNFIYNDNGCKSVIIHLTVTHHRWSGSVSYSKTAPRRFPLPMPLEENEIYNVFSVSTHSELSSLTWKSCLMWRSHITLAVPYYKVWAPITPTNCHCSCTQHSGTAGNMVSIKC